MAIAGIAEVIVNIFNDEEEDEEEIRKRYYQLQNDRIYLRDTTNPLPYLFNISNNIPILPTNIGKSWVLGWTAPLIYDYDLILLRFNLGVNKNCRHLL